MKTKTGNYYSCGLIFRILLIMLGIVFSLGHTQAQTSKTISGRILDNGNEPVIGATVKIAGTTQGVLTNTDGSFSIEVAPGATLEVLYVGYISQTIKITDQETLNIKLIEDVTLLEDVVVVGYGVQKKETLTGSVSNLKTEEIITTKAPSLAQSIQGKVAGLRIRQNNGEPGRFDSNINIRGFGTPLFIIDGVVRDGSGEFQRLNPEDIESISFLKDATAAIYGMNSANGAVIVTTKKGLKGKPRLTLNVNMAVSSPTDIPQMANAAQYMTMRNEAEINAGRSPYLTKEELQKWQTGAPGYQGVDLYDAVFNDQATQYQTSLSIEGGNENLSYFGSFGYMTDNSVLKNNALTYDKYTFRSNVSMKVTKDLTASVNIGGRHDNTNRPWFPFFDIFKSTRVNPPLTTIYANDNPAYYNNFAYVPNPMAIIDADYTGGAEETNKNIQTQFILEYSVPFVEGLKIKGSFVYDYNDYKYKASRIGFQTYTYGEYTGAYSAVDANYPSLVQDNRREANRIDLQFQSSYHRTFNQSHNVGATYIFERREERANWMNGERKFDFYTIGELDNARETGQIVSGSSEHQAYLSHIGRVNYDFRGKYLAEIAFRYDGSYRYAPGKRWAFFPSASAGWRISEESFIKDNFKFVDNFKIRGSIGRSGQDAGDPFQFMPGYTLNNGGYVFTQDTYTNGVASPAMINPDLTWITVDMYNLGFDLSFLNRLIAFEVDLYQRDRSGLLAHRYASLPNTFGATLPQENLNGDRTQGIEFTLSHHNKINDFQYSISGNFNLARTKNKYIETGPFKSSMERWRNQSAYRWNDFIWGYEVIGRFQNMDEINTYPIQNGDNGNSKELPGDYIAKDQNGDGIINDLDKIPLFWSGTPQVHFGLNVQASWKNFDFYALFQGSAFYTIQFEEVYARMLAFKGGNTPEYFYDRWHREDPYDPNSAWIPGEWPAIRLEQDMGSFYTRDSQIWRKDASYVRLKTVELGYSFDTKLLKSIGIEHLRVYVNGNNLFTFCDPFVKAFDPEKIEGNFSAGLNYPLNKSFNFGLTMNF
jgi:TonB-linked SusC/RagA family outer membrane protein